MRAPSIRRQKPDVKKAACTLFGRVQAAFVQNYPVSQEKRVSCPLMP